MTALPVAADVRSYEQVEKAVAATVERFGKIDIVVNGAAGNFLCKAEELSSNGFGTVVDIDLKGTFNVCRAAFEQLKGNRGSILNISATLHYLGTPRQLHVSAAKAGVDALDAQSRGRVGRIRHPRRTPSRPAPSKIPKGCSDSCRKRLKRRLRRKIPLGRFGRIRDIEQCCVFLCTDAASFINGVVIAVDGGHWLSNSLG